MDRRLDDYITALTRRNDVLTESAVFLFRGAVNLVANSYQSVRAAQDQRNAVSGGDKLCH